MSQYCRAGADRCGQLALFEEIFQDPFHFIILFDLLVMRTAGQEYAIVFFRVCFIQCLKMGKGQFKASGRLMSIDCGHIDLYACASEQRDRTDCLQFFKSVVHDT